MADGYRPQFRLIEILFVTACVGVLLTVLLPQLDDQRRVSKRATCKNNLKQLVMGAANFESAAQKLPANRQTRKTGNGTITVGWIYDLLPYIEQQPTYDLLKRNAEDSLANNTRINLLMCPNDPTNERSTATSYVVNGGCPNNPADNFDSSSNGVGDDLAGNFKPNQRATSAGCKDGTTSTIYYAENCNAQRWNEDFFHPVAASREYFHAIHWLPTAESELDTVFKSKKPKSAGAFLWGINDGDVEENGPQYARPSSWHPGGFQAAFVGSNVRYIRESIDYRVYAQLLSSNGLETIDPSDTSEVRTKQIRAWQAAQLVPQEYE